MGLILKLHGEPRTASNGHFISRKLYENSLHCEIT